VELVLSISIELHRFLRLIRTAVMLPLRGIWFHVVENAHSAFPTSSGSGVLHTLHSQDFGSLGSVAG
jgi:hypothetical protein